MEGAIFHTSFTGTDKNLFRLNPLMHAQNSRELFKNLAAFADNFGTLRIKELTAYFVLLSIDSCNSLLTLKQIE